jgi:hypothetical protein
MQTLQRRRCQTRARLRKKACAYGVGVSGATIYAYVGGDPVSRVDPTGLLFDTSPGDGDGGGIGGSSNCRLIRQTGPLMLGELVGQRIGWMLCTYDCGGSCPPQKGDIITRLVRVFNPPFKCTEWVSRRMGE